MLVLDVDRLKSINDTYGHLAGAEAVRLVGHTLAAHLPPDAVACRYGGDEFAIAIPNCGRTLARTFAEELRGAVHVLLPVLAGRRFSVGLAWLDDDRWSTPDSSKNCGANNASSSCGADPSGLRDDVSIGEKLFAYADKALYVAKQQGRNRVSALAPPA
jgi:GGDEF domain-containing protein